MSNDNLIKHLKSIVGTQNVYTSASKTEYYRTGFRSGQGDAIAVVFPTTLLEQWQVLQACVKADKIIIMQASNTGLTGGSTPDGNDYDREIVIINTRKIEKIITLNKGKQIISFPGATLHSLEQLLTPLNRLPHSVIGSSSIGASIVGGIANNSGGALVNRGPAYTEFALYAHVNRFGELELINHLGINLGNSPETILTNLENENFTDTDIEYGDKLASDTGYLERIRDIQAETPARYNTDPTLLYEASGSAGKLAIFAVRVDTFPVPKKEKVFYIGTNSPEVLTQMRQDMLTKFKKLPILAEYMNRDIFNISEKYGKDTFLLIKFLGTKHLPKFFALKGSIDARLNEISFLPKFLTDRFLQFFSRFWPQHLPKRILEYRDKYEHYLILKTNDESIEEAEHYLNTFFNKTLKDKCLGSFFICTDGEAKKVLLHRFAAAGSAVRYQVIHNKKVEEILALDIALKRNERDWITDLPREIKEKLVESLCYGHFLCHVFHLDYIVSKNINITELKDEILRLFNQKGAKYPAEHNVGHLYSAPEKMAEFFQKLDPTNTFNPGIGKTSKLKWYGKDSSLPIE